MVNSSSSLIRTERPAGDYLRYEQITNLDPFKSIQKADEHCASGWSRRGYPTLDLHAPIPWSLESRELRSWTFYLHSLDMIDALLAAHSASGDERFLAPALRIGLDWVEKHPRTASDASPMAWYDMAVGLRAYRLGYLFQAADGAGWLSPKQRDTLRASLHEHCLELIDDSKIAFHNNHGYFQVAGQLALGRRFADISSPMAALYAQGLHRIRRMLDQQFGPDGVHREHSPDYHRMVADTLLGLVRAGLIEDPGLLSRVDGIENALAWFVTPEGTITNFGDSDSRSMVYSAEASSRKWTTPLMRAVASDGATGSGWPRSLRKFAESGYAVVRCPDAEQPDIIKRDTYLAQTAAFHSRTHKHCDDLSFIWHERGQPLLVDAGRYGYIGKTEMGSDLWQQGFWYSDPMRVYMESTRAHNTLEFDGLNALRKGAKPYGSALVQACERSGVFCIETRCKQHNTIWHDRLLLLLPGRWLLVFDVYTDNLKQPHEVKQWFHLAPGHKAQPVAGGYDATLQGGGALCVRSLLGEVETSEVIAGRDEDPIQGWRSDKERSAVPADAFALVQRGQACGIFATLFTLSGSAVADPAASRSNVTGRKAQLAWRDANGHHSVAFERGEHFHLDYQHSPPDPLGEALADNPGAARLGALLRGARVVLQYGSGPATRFALEQDGPVVICVHYDLRVVQQLRKASLQRPEGLMLHHVDRTAGKETTADAFAADIWAMPWFRAPEIVLVGGSDAALCVQQVLCHIRRETQVLWQDYANGSHKAAWAEQLASAEWIDQHLLFTLNPGMDSGV
jgi:hypothetical protein